MPSLVPDYLHRNLKRQWRDAESGSLPCPPLFSKSQRDNDVLQSPDPRPAWPFPHNLKRQWRDVKSGSLLPWPSSSQSQNTTTWCIVWISAPSNPLFAISKDNNMMQSPDLPCPDPLPCKYQKTRTWCKVLISPPGRPYSLNLNENNDVMQSAGLRPTWPSSLQYQKTVISALPNPLFTISNDNNTTRQPFTRQWHNAKSCSPLALYSHKRITTQCKVPFCKAFS